MKVARSDIIGCLEVLQANNKAQSVTWFCGNLKDVKMRVRMTRIRYKHGGFNHHVYEFKTTIGKPNCREREFLAQCKKAGCSTRRYWINKIAK